MILRDPSGFTVEVLHSQAPADAIPTREPLALNFGHDHNRINHGQRPPVELPEVVRLGHLAIEVADYQATCGWYMQHLGLIPSDVQVLPDGSPAVTFLRLDLEPCLRAPEGDPRWRCDGSTSGRGPQPVRVRSDGSSMGCARRLCSEPPRNTSSRCLAASMWSPCAKHLAGCAADCSAPIGEHPRLPNRDESS